VAAAGRPRVRSATGLTTPATSGGCEMNWCVLHNAQAVSDHRCWVGASHSDQVCRIVSAVLEVPDDTD